jgi:hypothetical protein
MKANKKQVLKIIENMLYARRNNKVLLEQKYYDQISNLCEKYNADVNKTIGYQEYIKNSY